MITSILTVILAAVALICYAAERAMSLFSWTRLEELNPPRARRATVEQCLRERELVDTSFLVVGCLTVAVLAVLLIMRLPATKWTAVQIVALALLIIWVAPEAIAWRMRDKLVLYVVPAIYPFMRVPFHAMRMLFRATGAPTLDSPEAPSEMLPPSAVDAHAHEVFRMAVRLKHIPVRDIMTPRTNMVTVPETATLREVAAASLESGYSRLPVWRDDLDHIVGVVLAKDLLRFAATEKWDQACLPDVLRQIVFVPETKAVSEFMEEVLRSNAHLAVVLDEYGGTSGLVTLEDVVEELIGDIRDEYESPHEAPLVKWLDARRVEVQAAMRITDFNDQFAADLPVREDYGTVAGFVTFTLGKIPAKGESFAFGGGRIHVIEADPRRVIRVRVDFDRDRRPPGMG